MFKQFMQVLAGALTALILCLCLFACGGDGGSPAGAVEAAMKAMIEIDESSLDDYVCRDMAAQAKQALDMLKTSMDQGATMELTDMRYEVLSEADDKSVVKVTGRVKGSHPQYGDMEEPIEEDMDVILEDGHWKVCDGFL